MQLSLNIIDFLMLALVLQGFVLSGLLFYSSKKIPANRWIAAFIFVVSESTLIMELDYARVWLHHEKLLVLMVQLKFALGPLIYFYVKSLVTGHQKLTPKQYLNFLPMVLDLKYQLIYLLQITGILTIPAVYHAYSSSATQHFLAQLAQLTVIASFISLVVYSGIAYRLISIHHQNTQLSSYKLSDVKRARNLIYLIFSLIVMWLVSIIVNLNPPQGASDDWKHYIVYIPGIVAVYWLGMKTYLRQNKMTADDVLEYTGKPAKIYFANSEADLYSQRLTDLMIKNQLYLDPSLKVETIAEQLAIPVKAVSQLLNHHMGINFNDFINGYRVNEARKKLLDSANSNFTIAAIAFDCGFNSLATFQRVFKQITGITPSQYQNSPNGSKFDINNTQIPI